MVYSQELEFQVLSGILLNRDAYAEVASFLNKDDFYLETNKIIYNAIVNLINQKKEVNSAILIAMINSYNISFKDVQISDYIIALENNRVNNKVFIDSVKMLKKFSLRREYISASKTIINHMQKNTDLSVDEIISFVDGNINQGFEKWINEDDVVNIFEDAYDLLEDRGNNIQDNTGIPSPFNEFNNMFGGFKNKSSYVFASRPGEGKTTFLSDLVVNMANFECGKTPALFIDTEMNKEDMQIRLASSLTNISPYYLETGQWRKNQEFVNEIRDNRIDGKTLRERMGSMSLYYKRVQTTETSELINLIKRWYYTKVGRGNKCIIVLDYLKLANESLNDSNKEYQVIGNKLTKLNDLISSEVPAPLITAVQLNRNAVSGKSKDSDDTSSALSQSDRIQWFASFTAIFRRKTLNEVIEEGDQFGTHKLIPLKTRYQGKDAAGHKQFVKDHKDNVVMNFLNFQVENFKVKEIGNAESMYEYLSAPSSTNFTNGFKATPSLL